MKFGENLMMIRKRKNFSQEELANEIGVSRQTIYSWEAELNYPNIIFLKRIADALNVQIDYLVSGFDVSQLPDKIEKIELIFVKKHKGNIFYNELPNWFVKLSLDEKVCFALYDNRKRDFAYCLNVSSKAVLHGEKCLEIKVDEYDPHLNHVQSHISFVQTKNDEVSFIGRIYQKDGLKYIETFKDKDYLKNWGFNGKNIGQKMFYDDVDDYLLSYGGKKIEVIKISYFDSDGTKDLNHSYFETYLTQKGESLYWRRFTKCSKESSSILISQVPYKIDYECITNRLLTI